MAQYRVSSEQLNSTAGSISSASDRILGELDAVIKQVASTKDFWEGGARETYSRLMEDWKHSADAVREALNDTVTALTKAAADYDTTEQNQVHRFGA